MRGWPALVRSHPWAGSTGGCLCAYRTDHVRLGGWFVRHPLRIMCPLSTAQELEHEPHRLWSGQPDRHGHHYLRCRCRAGPSHHPPHGRRAGRDLAGCGEDRRTGDRLPE
uniref:Uncharacterized protein n=1 Tax=Panagrolaimus superbus TaxID=310955 RepID=A0A914YT33_9BILA